MEDEKHFTLEELSSLTAIPRRTIRFYMQNGIVPKPEGANRGAYYLREHLERLIEIQKWQKAGISLKRIRELLDSSVPAEGSSRTAKNPGEITVKSHIYLSPGFELAVDPAETGMTPQEIRDLVNRFLQIINEKEGESDDTEQSGEK
jgi:DNA-binding transcriptional MerR regulator